jgi:hypothetical protein
MSTFKDESKIKENLNSTIQTFLSKYQTTKLPENTSFQFKSNPSVFEIESQMPEILIKSYNPINKNFVFYDYAGKINPPNLFPQYFINLI